MTPEIKAISDRHDELKLGWYVAKLPKNCGDIPIQEVFKNYLNSGRCSPRDPYNADFIATDSMPFIIFDGFSTCWNSAVGYQTSSLYPSTLFISVLPFNAFLVHQANTFTKKEIAFFRQAIKHIEKQMGVTP